MQGRDHYFRPRPDLGHRPRSFALEVRGVRLEVETDSGVFARRGLDPGSRLLLELAPLAPGRSVLDLGCGWGALGLVAARCVAPAPVVLADINVRALALARANAERNHLDNATVVASDGFAQLEGRRFHLILCNPPIRAGKRTYYPWFAQAGDHLWPEGKVIAVVRVAQGAASFRRHLEQHFAEVVALGRKDGYVVLSAARARA